MSAEAADFFKTIFMQVSSFVDQFLVIGESHRCPLILLRERCTAFGITVRQVLAEVRSRYGNGSWLPESRMALADGSRPRGYAGFGLKDLPSRRPPFVDAIWPYLPFKGRVSEFPIPVSAQQLAGVCKSGLVVMVRQKDSIQLVRDCDPEYQELLAIAKRRRIERRERTYLNKKYGVKPKKPVPPFVAKIWPHLPYEGPISGFPLPVTIHQLAAACKSWRVAMISRGSDILIVRDTDPNYEEVASLAKDRRVWEYGRRNELEEKAYRWKIYLKHFPHPKRSA